MVDSDHIHTVDHMKDCSPCRREAWDARGGHPVLTGQCHSRRLDPVAWGPSSTSPKVEEFFATGDPDVF